MAAGENPPVGGAAAFRRVQISDVNFRRRGSDKQ
jgi:hypothetical protein